MTERVASLCSGYGGLELALDLAGIDTQLAWYAETGEAPSKVMAAHYTAPNLGDLCDITNPAPVDIVTAGFPCQPVSAAGQRRGVNDDRWLIDDVCRVARLAGAHTLILENVAGILTANDGNVMAEVCAAMAREGFSRWEWGTLRASDVGACHQRKRWFCVAVADTRCVGRQPRPRLGESRPSGIGGHGSGDNSGTTVTDADSFGFESVGIGQPEISEHETKQRGDADRCRRERFGGYAEAIQRWGTVIGRPAPDPATPRLNPEFVEWMMGLSAGWVTEVDLTRPQMLHVLGNGVVPQQAAAAVRHLVNSRSYPPQGKPA